MKTLKNLLKSAAVILLTITMISCSGDDGEQGLQGPPGEQGEQGPTGDQGPQGETGTANVIYSNWISANYLLSGSQESNLMGLGVLNSSELNPDTDVVIVYGRRDASSDTDGIYTLPYLLSSQDEYYTFGLFDVTGGTGIQVRVNTTDGGTNVFSFFTDYRYVIIPGGQTAAARGTKEYTSMSYKEISTLFNIE